MKVYVYPADVTGCGYYRLIWAAQALQQAGHDVTIIWPRERGRFLSAVIVDNKVIDVRVPEDADVIVMQRVSHKYVAEAVPLMRVKGIAVVIDIDDDLAMIHPDNPAFAAFHPARPPFEHNWKNVVLACQRATYVTTSTPALLQRYASHGRGAVVRNHVPARYLEIERIDNTDIGWGGSVRSHPNDLQVMGSSIQRLVREGHTFRVIGPVGGVRQHLILGVDPPATGTLDLKDEWPRALATLGVGVAPLARTRFNDAKSELKVLEMAALGVPCVTSPRAAYTVMHRVGVGQLAHTPKDWYRWLKALTTDEKLRVEMSERARDVARTRTIEENAWRWLEAWSDALDQERQHVKSGVVLSSNTSAPFTVETNG